REPMTDEHGQPVTIWDGISYKESPTTGELIPDESGRTTVYRYINPTKAEWPEADYIVGNPPFIGNKRLRNALGDGYVDALRSVYGSIVPKSADFVMYWWHIAAEKVRHDETKRFGFITTNSLRQTFNRRVLEPHLNDSKKPLSLAFAIPDHPWVDGNDGAAVRIAMTVGAPGNEAGTLRKSLHEKTDSDGSRLVALSEQVGKIFADLSIGANIQDSHLLTSNSNLSSRGVIPHGAGFILNPEQKEKFCQNAPSECSLIMGYASGRDLNQRWRNLSIINTNGLSEEDLRSTYPHTYQWLYERVRPERLQKKTKALAERWWLHWRPRTEIQSAIKPLNTYLVTTYVSKHRVFAQLTSKTLADDGLVIIALEDSRLSGVLCSRVHALWALNAGGRLGVGNDPMYNTKCFASFPFPDLSADSKHQSKDRIGDLIDELFAHRQKQQETHSDLTLTGMYNVLEKLRAGESLTKKEQAIHEQGLVSVLRELHDDLDRAVFAAYGWDDLADKLVGRPGATTPLPDKPAEQAEAEEELLTRLVDLNTQRAAEEARGVVRWLRPDYQAPDATQTAADLEQAEVAETAVAAPAEKKPTFPKDMAKQIEAIREALATGPQDTETLAARFKRNPVKAVTQVVNALASLGLIHKEQGRWQAG
ncbi:DNA methyltransferase, partial [Guyparkeria sp.]|uniref:DNA methyltransferase n=1 Tax=Guyparkeria sp. TaxID=2035736 RepID=UPI0039706211